MQRYQHWEYHVESNVTDERLSALGQTGWELVAVTPDPASGELRFFMKRQAADLRERVTLDHRVRFSAPGSTAMKAAGKGAE